MAYNIKGIQDFNVESGHVYSASLDDTFYLQNNSENERDVDIYKLNSESGLFEFVKTVDFIKGVYGSEVQTEYNKIIIVKNEEKSQYFFSFFNISDSFSYAITDLDFNLLEKNTSEEDLYDRGDTILQFLSKDEKRVFQIGENYSATSRSIYIKRFDINFIDQGSNSTSQNFLTVRDSDESFFFRDINDNIIFTVRYDDDSKDLDFYRIDSYSLFPELIDVNDENHEFYNIKQSLGKVRINNLSTDSRQDYIRVSDTRQVVINRYETYIPDDGVVDFTFIVIDYNEETKQYDLYNNLTISNLENSEVSNTLNMYLNDGKYSYSENSVMFENENTIYDFFNELDDIDDGGDGDGGETEPEVDENPQFYGSVEDAQAYFDQRNIQASELFATLTDQEKLESLFIATSVIDSNYFIGHKKSFEQYLEFPRFVKYHNPVGLHIVYTLSGSYLTTSGYDSYTDVDGNLVLMIDGEMRKMIDPDEIRYATYEMAYFLLSKSSSLYSNNENRTVLSNAKVDVLSVTFENNSNELTSRDVMPMIVKNYLKKYLRKSGVSRRIQNVVY